MRNNNKAKLIIISLLLVMVLSGCSAEVYESPIGGDIGTGWFQWIVEQIAYMLYWISENTGGYYAVGLIFTTILVRTIGWPIYSKSNDMTIKMQIAQPELEKIKEKYQDKQDPQAQKRMQMETMEVYKKYKINVFGCLLPFLQMPIFIAMYQVVRRVPLTPKFDDLDYSFFWTNLSKPDPYYILPVLVGVIMFFYQRYTMKKPEYLANKKYQNPQAQQTEKTMKMVSYFMVFMLVSIALTSAGIAFYWVIGNLYQFLQTYLNRRSGAKKFEQLRNRI